MDNSLFAGNAFTVVNFWFNGCKPCVEELDDLNALNEKVKAQGGEVIGINTETLDGNQQGIDAAKNCWLQRVQATATSTLPPAATPASLR